MEVGGEYIVVSAFAQAGPLQLYRVRARDGGRHGTLHAASSPRPDGSAQRGLAEMHSAHVATVWRSGYDFERGMAWQVTEPVTGRPLTELVAEVGPVPLALVSSVVQQALDAVASAHEVGRVHGALTPGCLFVESAGRPGGARVTVVGFGQEGARGRAVAVSSAADVRAIGALTLWMLSGGRVAFESVLRAVDLGEARVAPSERLREVGATDVTLPTWFDEWFEGCVAPESAGRFASAADAEAAWEQSVAEAPVRTSRARWAAATVAVVVVLAGSAVVVQGTVGARAAVGSIRAASKAPPTVAPARCPAGMAWIQGGQTMMGTREGRGDVDQHPRHVVNITGFCLDRTEVTISEYTRYWRATGARPQATPDQGLNCNWGRADRGQHPVNCIDWRQAQEYCAWTGHAGGARALPTEAQWEFAARGPEGGRYPWGSEGPGARPCWSGDSPRIGTCAVGAQRGDRTSTGVADLAGNVSEWTSSFYAPSYGTPGTAVSVDPIGPAASPDGLRVFRGGSWAMSVPTSLRAATRGRHTETVRSRSIGFRCARRP